MELDRMLPEGDVEKRHDRLIDAAPDVVWRALLKLDLAESRIVRVLMMARGIGRPSLRWNDFERFGFTVHHDDRSLELLLGVVAQPWRLRGGIRRTSRAELTTFDEPGYAVVGWNYHVQGEGSATRVTTVTRVRCTDADSRRRFLRYWRAIGPFSGLIRRRSLHMLARSVEDETG